MRAHLFKRAWCTLRFSREGPKNVRSKPLSPTPHQIFAMALPIREMNTSTDKANGSSAGELDDDALVTEFFKSAKTNDVAAVEDLVESEEFGRITDAVNNTDSFGNSPLMICSQRNWADAIELLLANKHCDVNHQNFFGSSALMCSSSHGHLDALRVLCRYPKVDIDLLSRFGQTALMKAAQAGKVDSIKILIDHGARVDVRNKQGKSAIDIAAEKGHTNVVELLSGYQQQKNS